MADNPQMLMAVSVGLILTCIIVIILFIIFVHTMPGKIARKRGNPQEEAIEILSLLGLLIFPLWMAALVWAYLKPFTLSVAQVDQSQSGAATSDPESVPIPESVSESASASSPAPEHASDSSQQPHSESALAHTERPVNSETQA